MTRPDKSRRLSTDLLEHTQNFMLLHKKVFLQMQQIQLARQLITIGGHFSVNLKNKNLEEAQAGNEKLHELFPMDQDCNDHGSVVLGQLCERGKPRKAEHNLESRRKFPLRSKRC